MKLFALAGYVVVVAGTCSCMALRDSQALGTRPGPKGPVTIADVRAAITPDVTEQNLQKTLGEPDRIMQEGRRFVYYDFPGSDLLTLEFEDGRLVAAHNKGGSLMPKRARVTIETVKAILERGLTPQKMRTRLGVPDRTAELRHTFFYYDLPGSDLLTFEFDGNRLVEVNHRDGILADYKSGE